MNPRQLRGTAAYKRLRAQQRAKRLPCWLCGRAIDYDAPPRSRWSFSLDHVAPLMYGGAILDPANVRSAHLSCNARRGQVRPGQVASSRRPPAVDAGIAPTRHSRAW